MSTTGHTENTTSVLPNKIINHDLNSNSKYDSSSASSERWCARTVATVKKGIQRNFGKRAKLPTGIAFGVLLVAGIVLGLYLGKVGPIHTGINSGTTFIHHNVTAVVVGAGAALGLAGLVGLAINYAMTTKKLHDTIKGDDGWSPLQRCEFVIFRIDEGIPKKDKVLSTAALVAIALTITAVVLYATNTAHMQTAINSYMGNHAVAVGVGAGLALGLGGTAGLATWLAMSIKEQRYVSYSLLPLPHDNNYNNDYNNNYNNDDYNNYNNDYNNNNYNYNNNNNNDNNDSKFVLINK